MDIMDIVEKFVLEGEFIAYSEFGEGHINDTFSLVYSREGKVKRYILQRINEKVFPNIEGLMRNIVMVSEHVAKKVKARGGRASRESLTIIKTKEGKTIYRDKTGDVWRMTKLIEDTEVYQIAVDKNIFEETGRAFGDFIKMLEDFPVEKLVEVIPNFHNTKVRFNSFKESLKNDLANRKWQASEEIEFALSKEDKCSKIVDMLRSGEMPTKVTHNDTKINNILMSSETSKAVCVIDLDTIMPGSVVYDFGDGIRSGCNTAREDERDLSRVHFNLPMFKAFSKGFVSGMGTSLADVEKKNLAYGAVLITFECGIRFLSDFLNGDTYFKTDYPQHNLVRARTQFKLVREMEEMMSEMEEFVMSC